MTPSSTDGPFARALRFLQEHSMVLDVAGAVVLGLIGFPSWPGASWETLPQAVYGFVVVVCCVALALRRRFPLLVLTVLAAAMLLHLVAVQEVSAFAAAVCAIAAYTTQTQLSAPWRWVFLLAVYLGSGTAVMLVEGAVLGYDRPVSLRVAQVGSMWVGLTALVLVGAIRRYRHDRVQLALERAQLLEATQETERRLAATQERARIAREIHDVLGHSLNVIAMQAEGIRHVLRQDPERADAALATVAELSRGAVDEVRDVVDVLRSDEGDAPLGPSPGLTAIPEMIAAHRLSGVDIRSRVEGDLDGGGGAAGFAAYRIAQEALTNAVVHAPGAPILLTLEASEGGIELAVVNAPGTREAEPSSRPGHGLIGMRERANALGGTVDAGADPLTGGWKVVARLPRGRA